MDILLILAAGKSSRFGGYPKAFCKIDDNYAAQRTVNLGGQFFDKTYLVIHKEIYHSCKNVIQNCKTLAIETGQGDAHSFLRAVRLIKDDQFSSAVAGSPQGTDHRRLFHDRIAGRDS